KNAAGRHGGSSCPFVNPQNTLFRSRDPQPIRSKHCGGRLRADFSAPRNRVSSHRNVRPSWAPEGEPSAMRNRNQPTTTTTTITPLPRLILNFKEATLSKYQELVTSITDERFLIEALQELGYQPGVCREGRSLRGYLGDERQERAHVIIPREQLDCASNDIGFVRDSSGV